MTILDAPLLSINRRSYCRRALGYLLLLVIAYGATAETVHSHGLVSRRRSEATRFFDASGSQSSHTGRSHQIECSMCAFQQQLFNGLVHGPLYADAPLAEITVTDTATVVLLRIATARPSGRAPPSN